MKIQPFKHGERWLLVCGASWAGNLAAPPSEANFEKCWTGDRWVEAAELGMTFESHELARKYFAENREGMERS